MADLLETTDDGVAVLTLNRPDRLNALSEEMVRALCEALPRLAADPGVGAIVLTGAGPRVLRRRGRQAHGDGASRRSRNATRGCAGATNRCACCARIGTVVIAAVNGPAAGAGLGLALACDLRLAARSARFRTAFAGVGFSGDFGGSWSLTRLVGTAKAREMYYLNPQVDAEEAARLGLVTRVVDDAA